MWRDIVREWLKDTTNGIRNQRWLADKVGCSESWFSLCLNGHVEPSEGLLYRLERAMDLERGALVDVGQEVGASEGQD